MRNLLNTLLLSLVAMASVIAADLTIEIDNIKTDKGTIGCALYSSEEGFPMERKKAIATSEKKAKKSGVTITFKDLKPGVYAVAVSHDLNDNQKTDTNFLGIPKEDWGVSNNVRPKLRAPTFEEAKFEVGQTMKIQIKID